MRPSLQTLTFLEEAETRQEAGTGSIVGLGRALAPIVRDARGEVAKLSSLLHQAELEEGDIGIFQKFEAVFQSCRSLAKYASDAEEAVRRMAQVSRQLDAEVAEIRSMVTPKEESASEP